MVMVSTESSNMEREHPGLEVTPAELIQSGIEATPLEIPETALEVSAPQAHVQNGHGQEGKGSIWSNMKRPIPLWLCVVAAGAAAIIILVSALLGVLLRRARYVLILPRRARTVQI